MPAFPDRRTPYCPRPLGDQPASAYVELARAAYDNRLALYVGAGVSVSTPSLLPTSKELFERLAVLVERDLGLRIYPQDGDDEQLSLEKLADAAEAANQMRVFRELAATAADFEHALPNYAHCVIAALMREGTTMVLSANWDLCIERGCAKLGVRVDPTISDDDRTRRLSRVRFRKVHGCVSRPESLLVSSEQLKTPPAWVGHEVGAALGGGTVVFVGLGTVGGYVRRRVKQLVHVLGEATPVWVADPSPTKTWEVLLERAGEEHILPIDADNFFDQLLRAFLRDMLARLVIDAKAMDDTGWTPPLAPNVDRFWRAAYAVAALDLIIWLREGAGGIADGNPFLNTRECSDGLLAVAAVAGPADFRFMPQGRDLLVTAGAAFIELAVWPTVEVESVIARETARAAERYSHGYYGRNVTWPIFHICVGSRGLLPEPGVASDITGESDPANLAEGEPVHVWVSAGSVLDGHAFAQVPMS